MTEPAKLKAGGALHRTHVYLERLEDSVLRDQLLEGWFCHVLGPSQTGKTSLGRRAAKYLEEKGALSSWFDLNEVYSPNHPREDFYFEIMAGVAAKAGLHDGFAVWLEAHPDARLQAFFENFLLPKVAGSVAVFIDEFDDLLQAPFCEEFLLNLRALYNGRSTSGDLARLTFCLIGTFPAELFLSRSNRSAFNVVKQVFLPDFSQDEVARFAPLMQPVTPEPGKLMAAVYEHVGGHPYMVQAVLMDLARGKVIPAARIGSAVTAVAHQLFRAHPHPLLSRMAQNIVQDVASLRGEDKLRLYSALWDAGKLDFRPQEFVHLALRLAGAAAIEQHAEGTFLVLRSRVIAEYLDQDWIAARFQELFSPAVARPVETEGAGTDRSALDSLTARVEALFCRPKDDAPPPYKLRGVGTELLKGVLYRFPLEALHTTERLSLQVFLGVEGLGGQLWEQEVRALLRLNARKHATLPTIRDGGHYRLPSAYGEEAADLAYILTEAGQYTLAEHGAMEHFRAHKIEALGQLSLLAEGLAILHSSGLMHRNLHPATVDLQKRDLEGKDTFLRMTRFEMAPLVANLLRRLDRTSVPDAEGGGTVDEMDEAIRSYYLDMGVDALACVAPERLGSIYALPRGSNFEGSNSDVFSLGVIAYQWFVGQLPGQLLQEAFGRRTAFSMDRWRALFDEMEACISRAAIHSSLKELLKGMLSESTRTRLTSAEVVDHLVRHFDSIAGVWESGEKKRSRPYLVAYLHAEFGEFLRPTGLVRGDPRSPVWRADMHRFLVQDLASPTLSFSPLGCAPLVNAPDERHKKSRFVLHGNRLTYFAHLFDEGPLGRSVPVPQVLVIRYAVEQHKVRNVNLGTVQRRLSSIEVVSSDSSEAELHNRTTRPVWKPLLDSVERSAAETPEEMAFLRALEWLLELQATRLDARTYPVRIDPASSALVLYDPDRDREWLSRTDLGSLFQGDRKLRPDFADHFEQEAYKKGHVELSFWRDDRGAPDYRTRPATLVFEGKESKDALRVKPGARLDFTAGWLQIADEEGTRYQIEQQRRAVFQVARMPELISQLQYPTTPARVVQRWPNAGRGLDGRAPDIIRKLLDSRPLFALQGPPGTGKTTVIADAVQQTLDRDRNVRILIAAQSHYALDNLLEKIHERLAENGMGHLDAVRIVSPKSKGRGFSSLVEGHFLDKLVDARKRMMLKHCDEILEDEPAQEAPRRNAGSGALSRRELIGRWRRTVEAGDAELNERLRRGSNLVFSTTGTATDSYLGDARDEGFDWVVVDEAAKAWPTELVMPLVHGQRWALVGDHKQLGAFGKKDVMNVLSKCRTSTLPELRQVGEQADAFEKVYEVFKHLIEGDAGERRGGYFERPVEVLNEQYRMHPSIGELISRRFYSNELRSAAATRQRMHGIRGVGWLGDKALVWVDTMGPAFAQEGADPKWHNKREVGIVQSVLTQLGDLGRRVVVLSPYGAQVKRLADELMSSGRHKISDRVHTVDEFQGRESDVVVVSMVRCNDAKPDEEFRRLGFLVEEERVNVLFSRARQLLVIVGCFNQFYKSESSFWPMLCGQIASGQGSAVVPFSEVLGGESEKEARR